MHSTMSENLVRVLFPRGSDVLPEESRRSSVLAPEQVVSPLDTWSVEYVAEWLSTMRLYTDWKSLALHHRISGQEVCRLCLREPVAMWPHWAPSDWGSYRDWLWISAEWRRLWHQCKGLDSANVNALGVIAAATPADQRPMYSSP